MKVSIIIPCYNEKEYICELVKRVKEAPLSLKEMIIVDDFSSDGTRELIKADIEKQVDKVIYHDKNMGKGASLRDGFRAATGDVVIVQDADLEYDPREYPRLLGPILDDKADVVFGSRFVGSGEHRVLYFWHSMGNQFLTFFSNIFTNLNLTDMETCYKAFRKGVLDKIVIQEDRFGFEPEIVAKVARLKCRIYEVGISYSGRTYEQGKKINWKDGLHAFWCILKYNLFS
jgi:glycosyltransferase involved in cell wall biosynthesis